MIYRCRWCLDNFHITSMTEELQPQTDRTDDTVLFGLCPRCTVNLAHDIADHLPGYCLPWERKYAAKRDGEAETGF